MTDREPSSRNRFDLLWNAVTFHGEDISTLDGVGSIHSRKIPGENGASTDITIRAHDEPHVVGSLRPRSRTLEVITGDGQVTSLNDVQVVFLSRTEQVHGALATLENALTPQI
ncbi:MAG: hypothetical protein ACR2LN_07925 [Candidatus Levyibacteriota bacterium]